MQINQFSSVQFSHSVVSDSLQSHGLQHTRIPCPSPTPRVYSNSCPSSRWCHTTISSVVPFSRLRSFPASRSFQMGQLFASGSQRNGSFSFNISPSNEYSGLISFLELFLHWSPVAYWAPTNLGSPSFNVLSFCLFIQWCLVGVIIWVLKKCWVKWGSGHESVLFLNTWCEKV